MKFLDDAVGFVNRYAPTIVVHALLIVWLGLFVIDVKSLPNGSTIWTEMFGNIDALMKAIGLSLERWYVLVALLLTYLTVFEWIRRAVSRLPIFRIQLGEPWTPDVLAVACGALRLPPYPPVVKKALREEIQRATDRVRQNGQSPPNQYLAARWQRSITYYETLLLLTLAAFVWAVAGSTYGRSPGLVWLTVLILVLATKVVSVIAKRQYVIEQGRTAHWALMEVEGGIDPSEDPLSLDRFSIMRRFAEEAKSIERHPVGLFIRVFHFVPPTYRLKVIERLNLPQGPTNPTYDWHLLESSKRHFSDEKYAPPTPLRAQVFAPMFASLLEREGTGLAILIPEHSDLAVATREGAARYSFATRRHEPSIFGVRLHADKLSAHAELEVETGDCPGFIASVGNRPLVSLIARNFPGEEDFSKLLRPPVKGTYLLAPDTEPQDSIAVGETNVGGLSVGRRARLAFGSSYIVGVKTWSGSQVIAALQCYRIEASERLLIVWGFVELYYNPYTRSLALPWWNPAAWMRLDPPMR